MTLDYIFLGGSRLGHLDDALQPAGMLSPPIVVPLPGCTALGLPCQLVPLVQCRARMSCARHEEAVSSDDQAFDVVGICVGGARHEVFLIHLEHSVDSIRWDRRGSFDYDTRPGSQFVAVRPTRLDAPRGECYIAFDPVSKISGCPS
jgi:hypothetical protein